MSRVRRLALLSMLALLTACPFLSIVFTSPQDGQRITGSRTIEVTGKVFGYLVDRPFVVAKVNGGGPVYAPIIQGRFRVTVTLADGENLVEVFARSGPCTGRAILHLTYAGAEEPALAVDLTSPETGETRSGDPVATVTGTVTGASSATVEISVNGGPTVTAVVTDGTFTVAVQLADGENAIVATATDPAGKTASRTVLVTFRRVTAPAIAITAPGEGQVVLGSRAITVRGTVTGATSPSVAVSVNGGASVPASVAADGTFSAEVQLPDGPAAVAAVLTGGDGTATATVHLNYPFLALQTFQAPERVIGRPGPTAAAPDPCDDPAAPITANDVCYPFGSAAWDGTTLFLSDWSRNRVLAFAGFPDVDGSAAQYAIGQGDFARAAPGVGSGALAGPETVRVADGKLIVAEYANDRLVVFDPVPSGFGAAAAVAVGAASIETRGSGACAADGVLRPESFTIAGNRLIVADAGHNRVLVWNQIPTVSGVPADLVLGQPDLATCTVNAGGISARTLFWPTDVWSDGTRLLVADAMNNRVLGWNTFPTESGAPADFVLGQDSLETAGSGTSRATFQTPYFLTSNGNQLFVADQWNHRVLVWNSLPTSSGALPDVVLGQSDFEHASPNDADQDWIPDPALAGRAFYRPAGVTVTEDALIVTDEGNSRYLVFRAP